MYLLSCISNFIIQGYILTSEIDGTIQMKSYLSGNPEIRLALNEDLGIGRSGSSTHGMAVNFPSFITRLWKMLYYYLHGVMGVYKHDYFFFLHCS